MRSMAISNSMRHHASIAYCIRSQPLYQNDDYQLLHLNDNPVLLNGTYSLQFILFYILITS